MGWSQFIQHEDGNMTDSSRRNRLVTESPRRRFIHVLCLCGPVVLWLAVIAVASTNLGSSASTDPWIERLVHLFSSAGGSDSSAGIAALSWVIRKSAHVVEYAILGLITMRAARGLCPRYAADHAGARWRLARGLSLAVLLFGAIVAAADEFHQTFVMSRSGSAWDALIDLVGVSVGLILAGVVASAPKASSTKSV